MANRKLADARRSRQGVRSGSGLCWSCCEIPYSPANTSELAIWEVAVSEPETRPAFEERAYLNAYACTQGPREPPSPRLNAILITNPIRFGARAGNGPTEV